MVEGERKPGFWIFIRHPCALIFGEAIIQSLNESADLVFITTGTREDYESFTIIKGCELPIHHLLVHSLRQYLEGIAA
jgi:hypothetical protein